MKVIDLLNKIANGEEVPKKITLIDVYSCVLIYDEEEKDYSVNGNYYMFKDQFNYKNTDEILNLEVKIIEEDKEKQKRIEKLGEELNKHFKLMVESEKYFFPEIHEDLLGKKDKEIEDLKGGDFSDHEMLKQVVGKVRQLISEVNELKKGK